MIYMKIEKIDIRYFQKDALDAANMDGVRHVKILPWLSIVQAQEGSYDIALGNQPGKSTGCGGFFIAPSGMQQTIVHHADPVSGRMRCRWIFLDVLINNAYSLDDLYDLPLLPNASEKLNTLFDGLFASNSIFQQYICCYQILELLLADAELKKDRCYAALKPVLEYIEKNYPFPISVSDLVQQAHISESSLYSLFKKSYGISPIAYLNRYRVSLAAEQLKSSNDTIAKIANSVGVADPFYFNKMFHKIYQTSPQNFRKVYRSQVMFSEGKSQL